MNNQAMVFELRRGRHYGRSTKELLQQLMLLLLGISTGECYQIFGKETLERCRTQPSKTTHITNAVPFMCF
jgi:hypothetical protein